MNTGIKAKAQASGKQSLLAHSKAPFGREFRKNYAALDVSPALHQPKSRRDGGAPSKSADFRLLTPEFLYPIQNQVSLWKLCGDTL
jgi:hypothetical protein